jgi:hypothetical protein
LRQLPGIDAAFLHAIFSSLLKLASLERIFSTDKGDNFETGASRSIDSIELANSKKKILSCEKN